MLMHGDFEFVLAEIPTISAAVLALALALAPVELF